MNGKWVKVEDRLPPLNKPVTVRARDFGAGMPAKRTDRGDWASTEFRGTVGNVQEWYDCQAVA